MLTKSIPLLALAAMAGAVDWEVGQTVETTSGKVEGHASPDMEEVSEYLGIPFAKPPTGTLRFQPPVPLESSAADTTFDATQPPATCWQGSSGLPNPDTAEALLGDASPNLVAFLTAMTQGVAGPSEDCLTLNIWTKPQTGEDKKAVLVWIHGGGYTSGSGALSIYSGHNFAEEKDVILVSLNYRLGLFGFPGNPTTPYNLGLMDQRLAVEWVRDNIAAFGGDVDRITLFGESAGGGSVDHFSYAWPNDPIAAGYIPQSGTADAFGNVPQDEAHLRWFNVTSVLGCGDADDGDDDAVLACMMDKEPADMMNMTDQVLGGEGLFESTGLPFGPIVDGELVFDDYTYEGGEARVMAERPMLVGNNDDEAKLFEVLADGLLGPGISAVLNDQIFTCPAGKRAARNVQAGNPTWRYRYMGVFPNLILEPGFEGAWHASEIPVLFGTTPTTHLIPNTDEQVAIASYMRGAWAAFAKDPTNGLLAYEDGWPRFSTEEDTLIRIGHNNQTGINAARGDFYDSSCVNLTTVVSSQEVLSTDEPEPTETGDDNNDNGDDAGDDGDDEDGDGGSVAAGLVPGFTVVAAAVMGVMMML